MKQFDKAIDDYSKDIAIDPEALSYYGRARTYWAMGEYEKALADINKSIEMDSSKEDVIARRAAIYFKLGKNDLALADISKAIKLSPNNTTAYIERGDHFLDAGEFEKALCDFDKVLSLDPNDACTYNGRSRVYLGLKKVELACKDSVKAVNEPPFHSNHFEVILYLQKLMGLDDVFEKTNRSLVRRATQNLKSNPGAMSELAWRAIACLNLGDIEKAKSDVEKVFKNKLRVYPSECWRAKGKVLMADGELSGAKDCFEKSLEYQKNDIFGLADLSECLRKLGNQEEAIKYMDKALKFGYIVKSDWKRNEELEKIISSSK